MFPAGKPHSLAWCFAPMEGTSADTVQSSSRPSRSFLTSLAETEDLLSSPSVITYTRKAWSPTLVGISERASTAVLVALRTAVHPLLADRNELAIGASSGSTSKQTGTTVPPKV